MRVVAPYAGPNWFESQENELEAELRAAEARGNRLLDGRLQALNLPNPPSARPDPRPHIPAALTVADRAAV